MITLDEDAPAVLSRLAASSALLLRDLSKAAGHDSGHDFDPVVRVHLAYALTSLRAASYSLEDAATWRDRKAAEGGSNG